MYKLIEQSRQANTDNLSLQFLFRAIYNFLTESKKLRINFILAN